MPLPVSSASVHTAYGSATDADRQVRQVRTNITRVYPESTPFYTLLNRTATVRDGKANKLEFQYMADYPRTAVLTSAVAADGTSIAVASASHITESTILMDPVTKEQILVTARSGNTLTVATRGSVGGGTPAALASGKELLVVSVAREEGADRLDPMGITPVQDYNYFQQFEQATAITDRAEQIMHYGPNPRDLDAMEAMNEYKKRIERQFLWGYRDLISAGESGATTHPRYIAGGLRDYVENANNVFDANGAFTYAELCEMMDPIARVGKGSDYMGICSSSVMRIINQWGLDYHQANHMKTKEFGLSILTIKGGSWTISLARSEQLEDQDEISNQLYIVNPNHVRHVYMRGLGDTVNRNVTGPNNDGSHTKTDQITGCSTLEVKLPDAHAIIENITS